MTESPINPHDHMGIAIIHAWAVVKKYHFLNLEFDEVLSECYIILDRAAKTFNPELGFKFITHAYAALEKNYWRIVLKIYCGKRSEGQYAFDTKAVRLAGEWWAQNNTQNTTLEDEDFLVHLLESCTDKQLQPVLRNILGDETLQDIADDVGVTKQRISDLRASAFKKLRKLAQEELAK